MSVLIFLDQSEGHIKKNSLEAASYGAKVAELLNTTAEGIVLGNVTEDVAALGAYGLKKIHTLKNELLNNIDDQVYTKIIAEAATTIGATVIIFSNNFSGKAIAPRLSAKLKAGLVSGAVGLPDVTNGFVVKKNVFSGKAFANVSVKSPIKIISLNPNSYKIIKVEGTAEVIELNIAVEQPKVKSETVKQEVPQAVISNFIPEEAITIEEASKLWPKMVSKVKEINGPLASLLRA